MNGSNFKSFLDNGNCLKIVCGAGNKDVHEIKNLCALYASAGCKFFDINASVEAIRAAKAGLKYAGKENEAFLCVSVGTNDDPHFIKCDIDSSKCSGCGNCEEVCSQKAVFKMNKIYSMQKNKCIGCKRCISVCKKQAINIVEEEHSFRDIIPLLIEEGFDCLEYHIVSDNETAITEGFNTIKTLYKGPISICLDRSKFGNERIEACLKKMKASCHNLFMIQADGVPMSGGKDDFRTTLQAVAMADIVDKANITPYVFISGGTNSKTKELAKLCEIETTGISIGSYARMIVKEYIENENFLTDKKIFDEALKIVKQII